MDYLILKMYGTFADVSNEFILVISKSMGQNDLWGIQNISYFYSFALEAL